MRAYEEIIREAELTASSAETVCAYLKERAGRLAAERIKDEGDEQTEMALLGRGCALIDIALAKYCRFSKTAQTLFFREPENKALRLAVLSNRVGGRALFGNFVQNIFDHDEERLSAYLAGASDDELYALFQNPRLGDSFLRDFLEGDACWQAMSEEKRLVAVGALQRNERMKTSYDDIVMDGYSEYSYGAVFDAAWKLAETAPTTPIWANTLHWLYDGMLTDAFSIKAPLELAARWQAPDEEAVKQEAESVAMGFLSGYQGVRKGLAQLALDKRSIKPQALLESVDCAFRSAAYARADMTAEQIEKAYELDGELAFQQMIYNRSLWRRAEKRQALHDVAWSVVRNDKHSDMMAANIFNDIKESMAKEHPGWFSEEDYEPEADDGTEPVTKNDLNRAVETIASQHANAAAMLLQNLSGLGKRIGWIWWFSLGAAAASIFRNF